MVCKFEEKVNFRTFDLKQKKIFHRLFALLAFGAYTIKI